MKTFFKILRDYYGLIIILFIDLVLIVIPFLTLNNLEGFDSAGHLASAYYIKNVFWPWPDGWNMMTLSGYPQGLFYPSLFHWLTAALSFILPLELSFKLLAILAILFFPIIVFLLVKKIFKSVPIAVFATLTSGVFYFFEIGLSDNMNGDLFYGMFSHLFSLTIFFIYLFFLYRLVENKKHWKLSALFLALCLLTHIITGAVAFIFALVMIIVARKDRELRKKLITHFSFALGLSLCWLIPFVLNLNYASGSDSSSAYPAIVLVLIPFIIFLSLITYKMKSDKELFFKALASFNIVILLLVLIGGAFNLENIAIHFVRFLIYPLLLAPISLAYLISQKKINWRFLNFVMVVCFLFYSFFLKIIPVGPFSTDILDNVEKYWQGGRVITIGHSQNLDTRFHSTRMQLAMVHNLPVSEGLFVESSSNGWFIMSLISSWNSDHEDFTWAYRSLRNVADISWASRIFGINYEYNINDVSPENEKIDLLASEQKQDIDKNSLNFKLSRQKILDNEGEVKLLSGEKTGLYYQTFYKINNTSLAEALSLRPISVSNDWSDNITKWWTTDWLKASSTDPYAYDKPVLVYQAETKDWQLDDSETNLSLVNLGTRMDSFMVDATSLKTPTPIYVKVGYFPFWHAYKANGEEIKIYKASPNFMLVYANDKITFKYIKPGYYYAGFIISGFALLSLLLVGLSQSKLIKNRKKALK